MMQSLSTSVTGLSAFSKEISVISNNVANSETSSYKASDVSFSDVLSQSLSGTSGASLGAGVTVSDVSESWTQGSITSTENTTDLAINGSGFFIVTDSSTGQTYYTRNGEFSFDDDGILVNSSDMAVQGYAVDEDGNLGALTDIVVSYDASPANATSEISTTLNLDADAEVGDTYESSLTVYDSLGNEHTATITYEKTDTNEWSYEISCEDGAVIDSTPSEDDISLATSGESVDLGYYLYSDASTVTITIYDSDGDEVRTITDTSGAEEGSNTITWDGHDDDGDDVDPGDYSFTVSATDSAGDPVDAVCCQGVTGTLTFNESGALVSGSDDPSFTIIGLTGAEEMTVAWDIADETSGGSYATNGTLTQYSMDSALYDSSQDGYASGELSSISISDSGLVTGSYSNGAVVDLYQLAIADFNNYDGLLQVSGSLYSATSDSGEAIIGIPGTSRFGSIASESLESSNVDLSTELASLITAQRAYQACSKVFSACDEILETLIRM